MIFISNLGNLVTNDEISHIMGYQAIWHHSIQKLLIPDLTYIGYPNTKKAAFDILALCQNLKLLVFDSTLLFSEYIDLKYNRERAPWRRRRVQQLLAVRTELQQRYTQPDRKRPFWDLCSPVEFHLHIHRCFHTSWRQTRRDLLRQISIHAQFCKIKIQSIVTLSPLIVRFP
jgi:hypothetical protein